MNRLLLFFSYLWVLLPIAHAATVYSDVPQDYWAHGYIQFVAEEAIMTGYNESSFGPDNTLTRAEAVKVLLRALDIEPKEPLSVAFPDVPQEHSLWKYIEEAVARNIVSGYEDKSFRPNTPVTRAEFMKILMTAANEVDPELPSTLMFTDVAKGAWYAPYVYSAAARHYVNGLADGTFMPNNNINRAQAAKIISLYKNKGVIPDFAIPPNSDKERIVFERINESRAASKKEPFVLNTRASLIAREHSQELSNEYRRLDKVKWQEDNPDTAFPWISHRSPAGVDFQERFRRKSEQLGIEYKTASENVTWATFRSRTIDEALQAMHTEMMLLPDAASQAEANQKSNLLSQFNAFTQVGIGIVIDNETQEITMTQVFVE